MTRLIQRLEDDPIESSDREEKRIRELKVELESQGYDVTTQPSGPDEGYDIIATKDGRKIAVEVKANSELAKSAEAIRNLRRRAREQGFDEFRLILIRTPQPRDIRIQGLEQQLPDLVENFLNYPPESEREKIQRVKLQLFGFLSGELGPQLGVLANRRFFGGAFGTDIKSVEVSSGGTRVVGSGVMEIRGHEEEPTEGTYLDSEVPFDFDITFDSNLENPVVNSLEFQLKGFAA